MQPMEKELMSRDLIEFRITDFEAHIPGGLPVMWRGCEVSTGPLHFGLDDSTGTSCGMMNYELGLASAEFHVLLCFPWLAAELKAQGADAELMAPVRGVLRAEGEILLDHSFTGGLRGSCKVESHKMFSSQDLRIEVLPGL